MRWKRREGGKKKEHQARKPIRIMKSSRGNREEEASGKIISEEFPRTVGREFLD